MSYLETKTSPGREAGLLLQLSNSLQHESTPNVILLTVLLLHKNIQHMYTSEYYCIAYEKQQMLYSQRNPLEFGALELQC